MSSLPSGVITYLPAPPPREWIDSQAGESPQRWMAGAADVERAVSELDNALAMLGERQGPRVAAAREWLATEIARLRSPLAAWRAWDSTVADLCDRLAAARDAHNAALAAWQSAAPKEAAKLRDRLESTHAELREVDRQIAAACEAIVFPFKPGRALEPLEEARSQTVNLVSTRKPMRRLHAALDQGLRASASSSAADRTLRQASAALWVVFETDAKFASDFSARHARFEEA